jgi:cleavage and polyadenylation specificity factor subunit 1
MIIFGKGQNRLEVMVVDFLPFGNQLFLVAVDAEENIHVLQFDPERKSPA